MRNPLNWVETIRATVEADKSSRTATVGKSSLRWQYQAKFEHGIGGMGDWLP